MAKIKIHAGDFLKGANGSYNFGILTLPTEKHSWMGEEISCEQIQAIEVANEENLKKLGGTVGWGIAGAALFGPAGLLAGLLLGGKKKEITFILKFKDSRKLLATTDSKTYSKLLAYSI